MVVTVCCIYIPPSDSKFAPVADEIFNLLNALTSRTSNHILICGDFNLPKANWDHMSSTSVYENEIIAILEKFNFRQLIDFPNAATGILDVLITQDPEITSTPGIDSKFMKFAPKSNHDAVCFEISLTTKHPCRSPHVHPTSITRYSFNKCDYDHLNLLLTSFPFAPRCYSNTQRMIDE